MHYRYIYTESSIFIINVQLTNLNIPAESVDKESTVWTFLRQQASHIVRFWNVDMEPVWLKKKSYRDIWNVVLWKNDNN